MRRSIQGFIKKMLEAGEKESRNESVIGLIKGLEEGLLGAIGTISSD